MDEDLQEAISCWIEEIRKALEEMKWQKYLMLLPNRFGAVEADPRNLILLYLSWLLTDLGDGNWEGVTAKEVVQILRDIADAIENCTEPF